MSKDNQMSYSKMFKSLVEDVQMSLITFTHPFEAFKILGLFFLVHFSTLLDFFSLSDILLILLLKVL